MSRIGKKPISIPAGVDIKMDGNFVIVKGSKGILKQQIHPNVVVKIENNEITINVAEPENHKDRALWGLYRSLLNNMVVGVTTGFEKKLEINGVGFKAAASGKKLTLNVGFSHPVEFHVPETINCSVEKNIISISGSDKQLVGEVAANIRKIKEPEPYKGKGIKYVEEVLIRKAGKAAGKAAA